jgi:hypothetical protein
MEIHEKYDLGFIEHLRALEKNIPRKRKFNGSKTRGNGKAFDFVPNLQDKEDLGQKFRNKETTSYLSVLLWMFMLLPFIEFQ